MDESLFRREQNLKNARFSKGEIDNNEIAEYWKTPEIPLFTHTLKPTKSGKETSFYIYGLTPELLNPTLENVAGSWSAAEFQQMTTDLRNFLKQRESETPCLLNLEYYIAVNENNNKPFATVGLYSYDIQGGAGLATRTELNPNAHHLLAGLSWFSIAKEYQGVGMGDFLLKWIENMARHRGVNIMFIETDDDENTKAARKLYEKHSYKLGFNVPNYFGSARDLATYWTDVNDVEIDTKASSSEKITVANQEEVLALAKKIFSEPQFEEFVVCLKLFLQQPENQTAILVGDSLVLRNTQGQVESFAILSKGSYSNQADIFWYGTDTEDASTHQRLVTSVKRWAKKLGKDILIVSRQGQDEKLADLNFHIADNGIPRVFGKNNNTRLLLYTKNFNAF